jgi:hypothetical protein
LIDVSGEVVTTLAVIASLTFIAVPPNPGPTSGLLGL